MKAEYVQTWLDTLSREGMPAQSMVVPVTVRPGIDALGLQIPMHDSARDKAFGGLPVAFLANEHMPPVIDLSARISLQDGVGAVQTLQADTQTHGATALLGGSLTQEALFQHALRFAQQQALQQLWVTPGEARHWLNAVQVRVP